MMTDDLRIALLWLIRNKQPISWNELMEFMLEGSRENMPLFVRTIGDSALMYGGEDHVRDLIKAGLIEPESGMEYQPEIKLMVTSRLSLIQNMFGLSLTQILNSPQKPVHTFPIFNEPFHPTNHKWAAIFVAMPFTEALRPIYNDHILAVTNKLGLDCMRGDDFFNSNRIMDDVWAAIYHSKLCIVDCTGRNPNVFYELGIAHTLGRKAILIAQTIDDIPFDVRDRRVITYTYTPPGMKQFEETLTKTIQQELGLDG